MFVATQAGCRPSRSTKAAYYGSEEVWVESGSKQAALCPQDHLLAVKQQCIEWRESLPI